jgi:hypothetical protein
MLQDRQQLLQFLKKNAVKGKVQVSLHQLTIFSGQLTSVFLVKQLLKELEALGKITADIQARKKTIITIL